jgi:hypothetical protein
VSAYRKQFPLTSVEESQIEDRITSVLKAFGWAGPVQPETDILFSERPGR